MKYLVLILLLFSFVKANSQALKKVKSSFDSDTIVNIGDVYICPEIITDFSGKRYYENSIDSVKLIAEFLIFHKEWFFEFSSHTDHRGNSSHLITLSEFRANFVAETLFEEYKIPRDQLIVKGYGSTKPIVSIEEIESAANKEEKEVLLGRNRRYELKVLRRR